MARSTVARRCPPSPAAGRRRRTLIRAEGTLSGADLWRSHGTNSSDEPVGMAGNDGGRSWRPVVVAMAQKPWHGHWATSNDGAAGGTAPRSAVNTVNGSELRFHEST